MLWLRQVTYASEAADHCHPELASTQTWSRLIDELRTLWATCNARYFACQPHLLSSQPHLPELWLGAGWDALLNKFGSFSLLCFWTYLLAEWLNTWLMNRSYSLLIFSSLIIPFFQRKKNKLQYENSQYSKYKFLILVQEERSIFK